MTMRAVEALRPRQLLSRILETPHLAQVIQSLEPGILYRLVRHCGLEDCGEIISLATTDQLMHVFDHDLWRTDHSGDEDQFDAERFGVWLEVLAEAGAFVAAQKIAEMDFDFVTAALSRYCLVLDQESLNFGEGPVDTPDDFDPIANARAVLTANALEDRLTHDIGGFKVIAKRDESWDALLSILISLEEEHRALFGRLMTHCSRLSTEWILDNGGLYEVLTTDEQVMADIAGDREQRREQEGYVAPSQAVAFLKLCRQKDVGSGERPALDPVTASYFRELDQRAKAARDEARESRAKATEHGEPPAAATERHVTEFLATLQAGGVIQPSRPPLLAAGAAAGSTRLSQIRTQLQFALEHDAAVHSRRTEELAYLANVLIAGCPFESRRFRAVEAADAVLAICNLGLQHWPSAVPPDFPLRQDLVAVFRMGWRVLYEEVCLPAARQLVEVLSDLRCDDDEVQEQVADLHRRMKAQVEAGTPWQAREELDVIATLDLPSWITLLHLVDECPAMPKIVDASNDGRPPLRMASEFEFISENSQITWVRDFVASLGEKLL